MEQIVALKPKQYAYKTAEETPESFIELYKKISQKKKRILIFQNKQNLKMKLKRVKE